MSSALRSINPVIRHYMRGSCHDRVAKKPQICSKYKQDSLEIHWIPGSVLLASLFTEVRYSGITFVSVITQSSVVVDEEWRITVVFSVTRSTKAFFPVVNMRFALI